MGKYIITSGQNIYDVALHLYGSVEGIVDLMMNNASLSLCDSLKPGMELVYTDDFIINNDIYAYYRMNNIVPSNGERTVYYKSSSHPKLIEIYVDKELTSVAFDLYGLYGEIEIDWGDNSPMQILPIPSQFQTISHYFDNKVSTDRKINIYGYFHLQFLDISKLFPKSVFVLQPLYVEKFKFSACEADIDFFKLIEGVYKIELNGAKSNNLLPLLHCYDLKELDLSFAKLRQDVIDLYLIALVNEHYGRRNCHLILTTRPSGIYQEPLRDHEARYIIQSGMEAIWVITHEPAWNEAGDWVFDVCGEIYTINTP